MSPTIDPKDLKMWLHLVEVIAPYILGAIPGVSKSLIPTIIAGIQAAEQIAGATGEQKQASVIDAVTPQLPTDSVEHNLTAMKSGIDKVISIVNTVFKAVH